MPTNSKTGALMDAAMMVALTVAFNYLCAILPLFELLAPIILPLPVAILIIRRNLYFGFLAALSIFLLTSILINPVNTALLAAYYLILGPFLGYCLANKKNLTFTMVGAAFFSGLTMFVYVSLGLFFTGIPVAEVFNQLEMLLLEAKQITIEQMGASAPMGNGFTVESYYDFLIESLMLYLPGSLILMAMSSALISFIILRSIMRRLGHDIEKMPAFGLWRLDWRLVWFLILGLGLSIAGNWSDNQNLLIIAGNLQMLCEPIFVIAGISFFYWLLSRFKMATFLKILLILILLQFSAGTFALLMLLLGIFDPILDFRAKIEKRSLDKNNLPKN